MPSMTPNAAAGAPSVLVSRLGSSAGGISWPRSARKLAAPIPRTPGMNHAAGALAVPAGTVSPPAGATESEGDGDMAVSAVLTSSGGDHGRAPRSGACYGARPGRPSAPAAGPGDQPTSAIASVSAVALCPARPLVTSIG